MPTSLAVLGCGTIGSAVIRGVLAAELMPAAAIRATRRHPERAAALSKELGIAVLLDSVAAAREAEVVLLGVKPQDIEGLLTLPGMAEATAGKLLISVAAGVRLEQLIRWAPEAHPLRAMPNTPARIREGMTVLSPASSVQERELAQARALFEAVGRVRVLDERYMDAVTSLAGSGPAFAAVILEAFADGGVMMGLPREVAMELAAQMMQGTARLVLQTGEHPAALKDLVTTPAGSTIAGLLTMEDGRIRSTLARTIQEAAKVAAKLGQAREERGSPC
ncbi:MAG: pyrroline-5-carboxylate reductase [Deltaproteobacteria bacterium]|nr:pyrroline-5-carboxylate reductase [Deltaproteobacteria bacterium]